MSEFRADPLFGSVSLISRERSARPHRLRVREEVESSGPCPLCPGNEGLCPAEIARRGGEGSRWQARAFSNRYPAVSLEVEPRFRALEQLLPHGEPEPGFGAHEVIAESPSHSLPFWAIDPKDGAMALDLVRSRIADLYKDRRIAYVQAFKNHRAGSGSSVEHPHFQLLGLPFVPEAVGRWSANPQCAVCALLKRETETRGGPKDRSPRLLSESPHFVAYADYAPSTSYQFSIYPKNHVSAFQGTSQAELEDFVQLFSLIVNRFERILGEFALNLVLYTAPNPEAFGTVQSQSGVNRPALQPGMHWFVRAYPRIGRPGGFELATSIPIVQVSPEDAGQAFREKGI